MIGLHFTLRLAMMIMKEAMLYVRENDGRIRCLLCRHACLIDDGKSGICNVRKNENGRLFSIFYAKPVAIATDPIEKKPFFHFSPGSRALSIATPGCNFQCDFCQNWDISQYGRNSSRENAKLRTISPGEVVAAAKADGCKNISYTYTEPTIFFEYAYDIAVLAKKDGLSNNFVTNGYMTRAALDVIAPYLDAANVDLKAFRKDTYKRVMKAELNGVLDTIKYMKELGLWLEITTLIVPGMNDDEKELADIADFIADTGCDIPWHLSRFVPHYRMNDRGATPISTLRKAYELGKKAGLRYVYLGNVPGDKNENTLCYACNAILIKRTGFAIEENLILRNGDCPFCKTLIDGVMMSGKPVTRKIRDSGLGTRNSETREP